MTQKLLAACLAATLLVTPAARAAESADVASLSAEEAHDIAVEAYDFLYPLVLMDVTRRQMTNVEKAGDAGPMSVPVNRFLHIPAFPPADARAVVRPNFDTLYSAAWIDVAREPMILSIGDTKGRYFLMPLLDMWTEVFASPGTRTTGNQPADYAIVAKGWKGNLPAGVQRIDAPTDMVWAIGRVQTNGPSDYAAVHEIQKAFRLTRLSDWGKAGAAAVPAAPVDPQIDMKTPPKIQLERMPAAEFYPYAARLLARYATSPLDQIFLPRLARIGIVPGKSFDWGEQSPERQMLLTRAAADALTRVSRPGGVYVDGWIYSVAGMGTYGTNYRQRAMVAAVALGANTAEDAVYPIAMADSDGKPFDGAHRYVLHIDKNRLPPVRAFWSLTLYDKDGYQVANRLNRFAIGDRDPLRYNEDGSLDLYIQASDPGEGKSSNWLPAPAGPFNLILRAYYPKPAALDGRWQLPAVKRID